MDLWKILGSSKFRGANGTLFDFILEDRRVSPSHCLSHREHGCTCIVHAVMEEGQCISTQVLQLLCLPFSAGTSDLKVADIQTTEVFSFSICSSHSVAVFCLVVFGRVF